MVLNRLARSTSASSRVWLANAKSAPLERNDWAACHRSWVFGGTIAAPCCRNESVKAPRAA